MKPTLIACILAVMAAFSAACAPPNPAAVPTAAPATSAAAGAPTATPARLQTLRIEVPEKPDIPDLPRVLAVESLREMGYTVETFQFDDNSLSVQALEQGDLDMGNVSLGIAWNAIQKGANLTTLVDDVSETRVLLVMPEIKSCADLDGKQVAVTSIGSTQVHLINRYIAENCPGTQIEPVIIPGSANRVLALAAGQLAAATVDLANYLAVQRQGNKDLHVLAYFAQEFPGLRGTSQVVRRDLFEKYPETAKDLVRAILLARRKISDPQVLSEAIVKYVELEPQAAQESANAFIEQKVWDLNGGLTPEMLQFNIDFFETAGAVEPGLEPEDVADLAPLNAVLDEIGRK